MDFLHANGEAVIAAATVLLVMVTACLAVYTALLWRATRRLAEDAQRNSERQAAEMKESLRIAALQAETASKTFIATHRPRVVVRRVSHVEFAGSGGIAIQYSLQNVGDSAARIFTVSENVWLPTSADNLPSVLPYSPPVNRGLVTLNSGDWLSFTYQPPQEAQERLHFLLGFESNIGYVLNQTTRKPGTILFFGDVLYLDLADTRRHTAFLRRYNFETGRFDPIRHSDYEYQD